MGLTLKQLDDMVRILDKTRTEHEKVFGTSLTKKEATSVIDGAIAKKRAEWLAKRLTDHTIEELLTLKEAVKHVKTR